MSRPPEVTLGQGSEPERELLPVVHASLDRSSDQLEPDPEVVGPFPARVDAGALVVEIDDLGQPPKSEQVSRLHAQRRPHQVRVADRPRQLDGFVRQRQAVPGRATPVKANSAVQESSKDGVGPPRRLAIARA